MTRYPKYACSQGSECGISQPERLRGLVEGNRYDSSIGAGSHAAIAGHPHLSVPMGAVEGLPVGLSIIGAQWDDAAVLRAGATYERVRQRA